MPPVLNLISRWRDRLVSAGIDPAASLQEQGLIRLSNQSALLVLAVSLCLMMPAAIWAGIRMPLLTIHSLLYPAVLLLNSLGRHQAARHSLILLLGITVFNVSLVRGIENGALLLMIPAMILAAVFFYGSRYLMLHLAFICGLLAVIFLYEFCYPALLPLNHWAALTTHLIYAVLSLGLIYVQIRLVLDMQQQHLQELNRLNQEKSKLFAILSHDLRNPLSSLQGTLSLLRTGQIGREDFTRLSEKLGSHTDQVAETLDNLFAWSMSQMEGIRTRPAAAGLRALVEELEALYRAPSAAKDILIINEVPHTLCIWADPDQVRIVLRNLIGNAIKFTGTGGCITVIAAVRGELAEISVHDTGVGMDSQTALRLFAANASEIRGTGTQGERGSGIGLRVSREMVARNHGTIRAESAPGQGCTVTFSLPLKASAAA